MKKLLHFALLTILILGVQNILIAQERVNYIDEPFETNLDDWEQTLASGSIEIVDNIDGEGKVVKLASVNAEQTFMTLNLPEATPEGEEYFIEYDYRTENTDRRFDNMQINNGPARLQTSLRADAQYWVHDNSLNRSESPVGFIQPNIWYHIKVRVNTATNTAELSIDDVDYGEFTSDVDLQGVSSFLIKVLLDNTFYVDNLEIYTFGEPVTQERVTYLDEPFETNLDDWNQTLVSGSIEIVDNIDGEGQVVKLTSVNAEQTFMSINLLPATPADEEYFIEYDYRTENTDRRFDNMQLNSGLARLQTSLRADAQYWVHDNSNNRSESTVGFIQPDIWYHIKVRVDPTTDTAELSIDDVDYGEFQSDVNLVGLSSFQIKVLLNNTFYVDNLEIYTFGEPLAEPVNIPEVPGAHPRVMANPDFVSTLRIRFNAPSMANYKTLLEEQAAATDDGTLPNGVVSTAKYRAFESSAFLYLINGDLEAGNKAKTMSLDNLRTMEQLTSGNQDRAIHRAILSAAFVYDWCYDLFTPEERTAMITDVKRLAATTEYGFPLTDPDYLTDHFGEEKIPDLLAFGIACYDEDTKIYDDVATQMYEGLVPSRNFFYPSNKHHQGSSYTSTRYDSEILSTVLMTRMGVERPYIDEQGQIPYSLMYTRRPDGNLMTEGDDFNPDLPDPDHFGILGVFMAAGEFQDAFVQGEALRYEDFIEQFTSLRDATLIMLIKDETLQPQSISTLPLSRYFGSPIGTMVARTGWDLDGGAESNIAIATMNLKEYSFGNHAHQDAGHFSLYYKGNLAFDSGALSNATTGSKFGGRSDHWFYYYQQSIAHNTLAVTDPEEPPLTNSNFPGVEQNEGGQPWRPAVKSFEDVLAEGRQAEILANGFGPDADTPDYTYLKGDIAPSYAYTGRTPKVSEAKRSFVFLNLFDDSHPAALIVYDKVTAANADFKKRWIIHTEEEPQINGNIMTALNTAEGNNGKLVNHALLPVADNSSTAVIGGPGNEFYTASTDTNFALQSDGEIAVHKAGRWRMELSPNAASATDRFLNVMQVMDAGGENLEVSQVSSDKMVGARIANRVVMFSKSGNAESSQRVILLPKNSDELKFLVTDLEPGSYDVFGEENLTGLVASEEEGTIYFTGPSGNYTIVPSGEAPEEIPISPTNFQVRTTDATCVGSKNGTIELNVVDESYTYVATVTGREPVTIDPTESKMVTLSDFSGGEYEVCFTIEGRDDFEQCFEVTIAAPQTLSAKAKVDHKKRALNLKLKGADFYNITINGETTVFGGDEYTVPLQTGSNLIEVSTDLECQGIFKKAVFIANGVMFNPNPTSGPLEAFIEGEDSKINLKIFSQGGQALLKDKYDVPPSRKITLDIGFLPQGIYFIEVKGKSLKQTVKIFKQ
ncbi:T9SS type A sorting domain-containing protein [Maribacter sp. 2210JD10-5]|uniref:T9SS type A sorting domain-containing protein n=1 Tax=Maribacter sp. 2210JD10-5 TaxID=3386272 RepID=UPI0039BD6EE6